MNDSLVFNIQRFSTHDGPGVRTTVFLKGCPLRCAWCHNPESQRFENELFYTPALCIGCGACVAACEAGAQQLSKNKSGQIIHIFDRSLCRTCLGCVAVCPSGALEAVGRPVSVDSVLDEVEKDRIYYEESGGGLTVSGGEPLAHFPFTRDLLAGARARGLHTCVETCGFGASQEYTARLREVAPLVDLFLWDLKDTDEARHLANTGVPLAPILANLRAVDDAGGATLLRCLLMAGINLDDAHLRRIGEIAASLRHCRGVELLAYHPLGQSKRERLGYAPQSLTAHTPAPDQMESARAWLRGEFKINVK